MRVIAGECRSLPLKTPEGLDTRPTQDRIKETLFNILQGDIPECVFVDMFAGSGGIGIEALSRGARKAYFIDNGTSANACITENLAFTKLQDRAIVFKQDVSSAIYNIYEKHVDIIFMDPPYEKGLERGVLELLKNAKYCDEDTLIIIEADLKTGFDYVTDLGFEISRVKEYKNNKHVFLHKRV
ncbi:MAG: 16S rRNA (guanine(966)-N(2))-methyltransferase RsmD [Lachnospiraceae bacterium]|nr:16S rRNA (guanine(966)-N(2))-methyltransferase RsmD [Lachnospiraceae bacterium]MBR6908744.1 16S rRNA (guanine(966)-N(2))-methyltransferase RsmD [Lachnospiraceae bacterium]